MRLRTTTSSTGTSSWKSPAARRPAINAKLGSKDPTIKSRLLTRYLFTCRCGLIDMRHFIQLLYILKWPVRSADRKAIDIIRNNSTPDELKAEPS